jgi:hypothetical protein
MTRRFTSLSREERTALLDAKQSRFLENLAKAMGPDPDSNTPSRFLQRRGRTAIPVRMAPQGAGKTLAAEGVRNRPGAHAQQIGGCVIPRLGNVK